MAVLKTIAKLMPTGLRAFLKTKIKESTNATEIAEWKKAGCPLPPPGSVKRKIIADLQKKNKFVFFIETGTYLGDMVNAQKNNFEKIYSIELGVDLHKNAFKKFEAYKHITILQGDSGIVLKDLISKITSPAIFWLDGHYSEGITAKGDKDCPIYEELKAIFTSKINHVLLIDDARLFNGANDYPTVKELGDFVLANRPKSTIAVNNDIIQVVCA